MICRAAEMQCKELVDISDGTRYGFISDLEFNTELGTIENIIIYGRPRCLGLLGREPDIILPWASIKRIGADIILVDGTHSTGRQAVLPHNHLPSLK